jgi:hypothetical protein
MWSLGATLYAALEGRPPHDADSALGTLTAVISDPVEPPAVGGPLRDAILGLLERDPAERLDIPTTRDLLSQAALEGPKQQPDPQRRTTPPAAPPPSRPTVYGEPAPRRRPSGLAMGAGLIVLLLLALGGIALMASRGDNSHSAGTEKTSTSSASPGTTSSGPQTVKAAAGFRMHEDPTGFSVAVPAGWQTSRRGTQVKFTEPGTTRYLLVDQTDSPKGDPKADWERQEPSFASTHDNYHRIGIESVQYRDYPAADWTFTYATQTQVINRGFVAGNKGYALYLSGPRVGWSESEQIFSQAAESFQPAAD